MARSRHGMRQAACSVSNSMTALATASVGGGGEGNRRILFYIVAHYHFYFIFLPAAHHDLSRAAVSSYRSNQSCDEPRFLRSEAQVDKSSQM